MIAMGLIAPWVLPSVWTTVVSIFCYYAILTIGWNIIFGYTGLFSYGHVAFPAIGGYTSALLAEHMVSLSPIAFLKPPCIVILKNELAFVRNLGINDYRLFTSYDNSNPSLRHFHLTLWHNLGGSSLADFAHL